MISIIGIQDLTQNSYIISCFEVINTNSCDVAYEAMKKLEKDYEDMVDFYLASGDWSHVDFWSHSKASIRNEHVKVINHYNCEE
mgnify:FL=1